MPLAFAVALQLHKGRLMISTSKLAAMRVGKTLSKTSLTQSVLLAVVIGLAIGAWAPELTLVFKPFKALFLNGIKYIIAPLILATLISTIAGARTFKVSGLMRLRAITSVQAAATFALLLGVGIADAITLGDVLQFMILAALMGIAVRSIGKNGEPVVRLCESLVDASLKFSSYLMHLAPLAVVVTVAALSSLNSALSVALMLFAVVSLLRAFRYAETPLFNRELHAAAIVPVPLTWEMPSAASPGPKTTYAYDDGQAVS